MFKKKLLLLQNSFDNITTTVRRSKSISVTPGESRYGSAVLSLFSQIFNRGSLLYGGNSSFEVTIDGTYLPGRNITNSARFDNSLNLSTVGSRNFAGNTTLNFDIDLLSTGSRNFAGSTNLINTYSLINTPSLDIAGSTAHNVVFLLNSDGELLGQELGSLSLSAAINLLARASLDISSSARFDNSLDLNSFGSRDFSGRVSNDIVILLSGDGSTSSDQLGYTTLSSIISLLCNGSLEYSGQTQFNNTYSLNNIGHLDFNPKLSLRNDINLIPFGVLDISGLVGKTIVIDLTSNGITTAFADGSLSLSLNNILLANGSLEYNGFSNLNIDLTQQSRGNLTFDGRTDFIIEQLLNSTLSGNLGGQTLLNIDFDLLSSLTTQSFSIKELLFNLNILQSLNKSLTIKQSNTFTLK